MPLPLLNEVGELPVGVHSATLEEVMHVFGRGSAQRRRVGLRLQRIHQLATETGHLARFVVFGSFVTSKGQPNDVDIVMVMSESFNLSSVEGEAKSLFRHDEAQDQFGASIFWVRRPVALGGEEAMIQHWQLKRDGGLRGIIEIREDAP